MQRLEYVRSTGSSISLESLICGETVPSLRGRAWTYTLGMRTLTGVVWRVHELTLTVKAVDDETRLDRLYMLTDHDMLAHSRDSAISGLLRMDGVWERRALIAKSEPQSITPCIIEAQLAATQLGMWRRSLPTVAYAPNGPDTYQYLNHPYNMGYDHGPPSAPSVIAVDGSDPTPLRMTIYGPCLNPTVAISGNQYRITGDILGGAHIEMDVVEGEHSVVFVNAAGDRINWFANTERGADLDSDNYIFQPLPADRAEMSWPGSYTFEPTPVEERSEPSWSAS